MTNINDDHYYRTSDSYVYKDDKLKLGVDYLTVDVELVLHA